MHVSFCTFVLLQSKCHWVCTCYTKFESLKQVLWVPQSTVLNNRDCVEWASSVWQCNALSFQWCCKRMRYISHFFSNWQCPHKIQRTPWGMEKEGGGKPHKGHPSQKGVLDHPPFVWYVLHPPVSLRSFPVSKIEQTRSCFGGIQKLSWRVHSLVRSPPSIRFAPLPCPKKWAILF